MGITRVVGVELPADLIGPLRSALEREGECALAKRLGISRATIMRALAGFRLMPGSIALLRQELGARAS